MGLNIPNVTDKFSKETHKRVGLFNLKEGDSFHEMYSFWYMVEAKLGPILQIAEYPGGEYKRTFWCTIWKFRKLLRHSRLPKKNGVPQYVMYFANNYFETKKGKQNE